MEKALVKPYSSIQPQINPKSEGVAGANSAVNVQLSHSSDGSYCPVEQNWEKGNTSLKPCKNPKFLTLPYHENIDPATTGEKDLARKEKVMESPLTRPRFSG